MTDSIIKKCDENGSFIMLEDGFTYFIVDNHGVCSADNLRIIADELDKRNIIITKSIWNDFKHDPDGDMADEEWYFDE